jgi:hypothetical protein
LEKLIHFAKPSSLCSRGRDSTPPASTNSLSPIRLLRRQHLTQCFREFVALVDGQMFVLHHEPAAIDLFDFQPISGPRRSRRVVDTAGSNLSHPCRLEYVAKASKRRFLILLPFLHSPCRILFARWGASTSADIRCIGSEADLIVFLPRVIRFNYSVIINLILNCN